MKILKRIFVFALFAFAAVLAFGAIKVSAADAEYSYTFTAKQYSSFQTIELGDVSWTAAGEGSDYFGYDGTKGQQFGKKAMPLSTLTVSTSDIKGTISKIIINTSGASGTDASLTVTVGGTKYGDTISLTTTATNYTFNGSSEGEIVFSYTLSAAAVYIKSITVTYEVADNTPKLDAPVATMNNKLVSWNTVSNAVSYRVGVFSSEDSTTTDEVFTTENLSYDLAGYTPQGTWYVKVQALGDGNTILNSEWTSSVGTIVNSADPIQMTATELLAATLYKNPTTVVLTGNVTGYHKDDQVAGYNETYGNVSLYVTDGESTITVYRAKSTDNPEYAKNVQAGDYVKIVGVLAEYQGKKQIGANCQITEFKPQCAVGVQTADAGEGKQHVRLVGKLNVNYEEVTALSFTITDANDPSKTTTIVVKNVFGTLTANGTSGVTEITAASLGVQSLFALTITNIPAGTTLDVTATFTTASGTYTSAVKTVEVPAAQ